MPNIGCFSRSLLITICLFALLVSTSIASPRCGDINNSGSVNVMDVVRLISYLYKGGPAPAYMNSADVNYDGAINIIDVVWLMLSQYKCPVVQLHCPALISTEEQSECLAMKPFLDGDSMSVQIIGDDLYLYHFNAYYNCCMEYYVDLRAVGNLINAYEYDLGEPCYCLCYFNLEAVLNDLLSGTYIVTLIGIELDTVGVDTVIVDYPSQPLSLDDCR